MTEHLARCESCYEIFAGAAHFQEEEEDSSAEDTGGGGVIIFPLGSEKDQAPRRIPRWLPLAASFLVAALGFMIWQNFYSLPEITAAGLVDPLRNRLPSAEQLYQPEGERGNPEAASLTSQGPYFFTGVYLIDLHLSTATDDFDDARESLRSLAGELDQILLRHDDATRLQETAEGITDLDSLHQFAQTLPQLESGFENQFSEDHSFAFGLWTEAGRLAALTSSPKFFEQRMNRRFLSAIPRQISSEVGDDGRYSKILDDLRKIEALWGERRKEDYQALAGHFNDIIEQMELIQKQDQQDQPDDSDPGAPSASE